MSDSKYSVLFMRDDADVRRYRVRPFWLKLFLYSILFLVLLAAGGVYLGISSYNAKQTLELEKKALKNRLVEAEVRLERLGNMEKILKSYDQGELQALLSAGPAAEPAEDQPPKVDLDEVFQKTDAGLVGVENLQARLSGGKLTVSFELNNLQSSGQLSGLADMQVVTDTGNVLEVEVNKNDTSFQISRFKRIRTTFALPEGVEKKNLFGIRLEITGGDDKVIYSETYPLFSILAS